jgi:hypothetical protein
VATAAVLATVELLTGPLRPDPLAETSAVSFHILSAQNRSPLVPGGPPHNIGDRLTGNQIGNFGAFLSARWRLNDWTWGRLDAAYSLVDIVTQPRRGDVDRLPALRAMVRLPETAELRQVREELVFRLHEEILREELPVFSALDDGPPKLRATYRGHCLRTYAWTRQTSRHSRRPVVRPSGTSSGSAHRFCRLRHGYWAWWHTR